MVIWNSFKSLIKQCFKDRNIQQCSAEMTAWRPYLMFLVSGLLTLVRLWLSTLNFSSTMLVYMDRSLLISDVIFKMATWLPYWIFVSGRCRWHGFRSITWGCFGISVLKVMWLSFVTVGRSLYWFSTMMRSKWPPGGHIECFGFQTVT